MLRQSDDLSECAPDRQQRRILATAATRADDANPSRCRHTARRGDLTPDPCRRLHAAPGTVCTLANRLGHPDATIVPQAGLAQRTIPWLTLRSSATRPPMQSQDLRRIAAPLARRLAMDADAAQIADAVVALWQEVDAALAPVVGRRGVAVLLVRSVHVASAAHPWMAALVEDSRPALDPAALQSLLARQSSAEAAAGGSAVLRTVHELLTSLVGPSLSERLLRTVGARPSDTPPTHDTSP